MSQEGRNEVSVSFGRLGEETELLIVCRRLHDRELSCLKRIAERLLMGQEAYGKLSPGKRDWKREAKEEAMDMAVYLSALLEDDADGR